MESAESGSTRSTVNSWPQISWARNWFSRFDNFRAAHLDSLEDLLQANRPYKRVGIAILDTRLNERHPVILQNPEQIVEMRTCVEDGDGILNMSDMPETAHGRHTVALVPQTALFAHICIARISKGISLGKAEHTRDVNLRTDPLK